MKTQSVLKVYPTGDYKYIYCYYKLNGKTLKIPTYFKYEDGKMTKELLYKATIPDYENYNKQIMKIKGEVDRYITSTLYSRLLHKDVVVSQKECLVYINRVRCQAPTHTQLKQLVIDKEGVMYHYESFYKFKASIHNPSKIKYYISLKNALLDYQTYTKKELTFNVMNTVEFCADFRKFLSIKHPKGYLTEGELNDNTINKRFKSLKTFFRYLGDSQIFTFKDSVKHFAAVQFDINRYSLTEPEIELLYVHEFKSVAERKLIDLFCLNCYLGLRFSDLYTLNKKDFRYDGTNYTLIKETKKTKDIVEIPITPFAFVILQKYNFELPKYSNQYFNRVLKVILEKHDLFNEIIVKKNRVLGEKHDTEILKRNYMSSHTARRSFITNCLQRNIPINLIMAATAHKDLASVNKYVVKKQDTERFLSGFAENLIAVVPDKNEEKND